VFRGSLEDWRWEEEPNTGKWVKRRALCGKVHYEGERTML
jgi:hypothetical protein